MVMSDELPCGTFITVFAEYAVVADTYQASYIGMQGHELAASSSL